jgi:hypothetical protein
VESIGTSYLEKMTKMRLQKISASTIARSLITRAAHPFSTLYPVRHDEIFSPFFIVGSGRSGNTLLRRVITGHPGVYIPPETYVLGSCVRTFEKYSYLDWRILSRIILSMFAFSQDFETFPIQSLHPIYQEIKRYPHEKRSLDQIINAFYVFMLKQAKPSAFIWGDKTPMNSFYLDDIDRVFPRARYIHIIRDGCDVISSYLEMGRYSTTKAAATRWRKAVTVCRNFGMKVPERYLEVRYETLVTQPKSVMRDICEFLDVGFRQSMIEVLPTNEELGDVHSRAHYSDVMKPISRSSVGKGRKKFTVQELREIQSLIGIELLCFGYKAATD